MNPIATVLPECWGELSEAATAALPLDGLEPGTYAREHATFEARSNQRALIADWLARRLAGNVADPLSVLSVGCGDGSLDAVVAQRLVSDPPSDRRVRWVGVEPFSGSAQQFEQRLRAIDSGAMTSDVHVARFADVELDETFDVAAFVHSMYYVRDVSEAVDKAARLVGERGEVLVLSAPRGDLNRLAGLLAPPLEGHDQWFSDDVRAALEAAGSTFSMVETLDAVVDLTEADDDVLDFTVQACLTPSLRPLVRRYLAEVSLVPGRSVVAHPVDAYVIRGGVARSRAADLP